jgi:hypothetical protein
MYLNNYDIVIRITMCVTTIMCLGVYGVLENSRPIIIKVDAIAFAWGATFQYVSQRKI